MLKLDLQLFAEDESIEGASVETTAAEVENTESTESAEAIAEQSEVEEATEEETQVSEPVDINAIYAKARRRAEEEVKAKQAKRDEEFVRRFGNYVNPKTGKRILSEQDYFDALDAQEQMKAEKELEQAGVDTDIINRMVMNNPAVRAANAYVEASRQREVRENIDREVAEIGKLNPNIKALDDIPKDVVDLVTSGKVSNLVDAYKVYDYGTSSRRRDDAIRQQTLNQVRGKQHLAPANGVSVENNMKEIPVESLSRWREFYPDLSIAELTKKYNKALNQE